MSKYSPVRLSFSPSRRTSTSPTPSLESLEQVDPARFIVYPATITSVSNLKLGHAIPAPLISPALSHLLSIGAEAPCKKQDDDSLHPTITYTYETSWTPIKLTITYDAKASPDPSKSDPNSDECCVCGKRGDLVMCDHCPNSFHFECHSKGLDTETGEARCADCLSFKETRERLQSFKVRAIASRIKSLLSTYSLCS